MKQVISPVFVIGSGRTTQYLDPEFFKDQITIGINQSHEHFPCLYTVVHHKESLLRAYEKGATNIWASKCDTAIHSKGLNPVLPGVTYFKHEEQPYHKSCFDWQEHEEYLVEGGTTTIPAMSLAASLSNRIILVGIDGAELDGRNNRDGYHDTMTRENNEKPHAKDTNSMVRRFRDYLKTKGVMVYSLSPFVNIYHEEHKVKR